MATTAELPEPPGSGTEPPPPLPLLLLVPPAAGGGRRLRGGARGRRLLLLQALDVALDAGRHRLEAVLQAEDLVLLRGTLGDELGGRLLVGVELDAAVLDVLLVGGDGLDGVDVAVAQTLHEVELGDEVVEAVRGEEDVDDADVARLVDALARATAAACWRLEVVLGDLEEVLVLLDLLLHGGQLAGGLVVLLDRHVGLVVDALQLRLDLAQPCFLLGDGGGGSLRRRERRRGGGCRGGRRVTAIRRLPFTASPPFGRVAGADTPSLR